MATKGTNLGQFSLPIDQITPAFLRAITRSGNKLILWGPVGTGKTDVAEQLAHYLTKEAKSANPEHEGWEFRAEVVANLNPEDVSGLPIIDQAERATYNTRPKFMGKAGRRYVLLLDEFNRAPQSYRNTLMSFLLTGKIGDHELHPETIVILAGNAGSHDVVGLQRISYADRNRLVHVNVTNGWDTWSKWAFANNVHPVVLGYLGNGNHDKLYTEPSDASNEAFATPRSWAAASKLLSDSYFVREHNGQFDVVDETRRSQLTIALQGTLGTVANELMTYLEVVSRLPSPEETLKKTLIPDTGADSFAMQYASVISVVAWLSSLDVVKDEKDPKDATKNQVVPRNFTEERFLQFIALIDKYKSNSREELRACAVRMLFKRFGYLFPNRQANEKNPIALEYYAGKGPKGAKAIAELLKEIVNYVR